MKKKEDSRLKALSENIRMLRVGKNLTQKEMGAILKVSSQSISGYENGDVVPDIGYLYQYADYFHVSINYLLGVEEGDHHAPADDLPTSSELQLIRGYRRRTDWEKKAIRSFCFHGNSYRTEEEEANELIEMAEELKKKALQ